MDNEKQAKTFLNLKQSVTKKTGVNERLICQPIVLPSDLRNFYPFLTQTHNLLLFVVVLNIENL